MSNFNIIISVVIPTYKPGNYIYECISSIVDQSIDLTKIELIIVINGCNEPFYSNLSKFLSKCGIFNYSLLQTDFAGVSNARNKGITKARGKYLCFIDDDDLISKNYLAGLLKAASDHSIVVSNVKCFTQNLNTLKDDYISRAYQKYYSCDKLKGVDMRKFLSSSCCKMIPLKIIDDTKFNLKLKRSEDACFMFELSKNIDSVILSDESVIYYRRLRGESASRNAQTVKTIMVESIQIIGVLIKTAMKKPLKYNYCILILQIMACLKLMLFKINNRFSSC